METGKENRRTRKERDLRYRMRKKGYIINLKQKIAVYPECDRSRSTVQEGRLRAFEYGFQYNMFK
jgi:undecaprenyl pyrophosphate phosphatase UppP